MRPSIQVILLLLYITLSFQACNNIAFFNTSSGSDFKSEGNGDVYTGKPTPYNFISSIQPCAEKGANGVPLPNNQIFVFPSGQAQFVRENCADIIPKPLNMQEVTFGSNGEVVYRGQTYASNANQGPFDVLAATCPLGRSPLATPVRTNMILDSLDLLSTAWWDNGGYNIALEGSLGSLPVFKVDRPDPNALENWRRVAQIPTLVAGETYVYSFYVKPDPTQKVRFMSYYPNLQDFELDFDLVTGALTYQMTSGVNLIATKSQMINGGLYINIYFQSLADTNVNIGIGPHGEYVGSSISTTAFQLEKLSNFCSP